MVPLGSESAKVDRRQNSTAGGETDRKKGKFYDRKERLHFLGKNYDK
jgi:hypothetical protein